MKILILSDLHIGIKAKDRSLCPYSSGLYKDDLLVSSFFVVVKKYIEENGNIDFLIIPGDITHQSNIAEYMCATTLINDVISQFSIPKEKIIFVPGNHDVDWSVFLGATILDEEKIFRKEHKYNSLKDSRHVFSELASVELTNNPYLKIWEYDSIIFVGLNSSWHDDMLQDTHFGMIDEEQLKELRTLLITLSKDKFLIFVVHHHLHQFANPHKDWHDISIMQNSQPLLELLSEFSFKFIIHGHRHVPKFLTTSFNGYSPINIFCSGSYSCEIHNDISGSISNTFHMLELDSVEKCHGIIKSWAFNPSEGWIQSQENHGIEYENPFGYVEDFEFIYNNSSAKILRLLKNKTYISYNDLLTDYPELKYLQLTMKARLFDKIHSEMNIMITTTASKEVIFVKKE